MSGHADELRPPLPWGYFSVVSTYRIVCGLLTRAPPVSLASLGALTLLPLLLFRVLSLYDPQLTGTGHQPRGFDQYATTYNHYLVERLRFSVDFTSQQGATVIVGCALRRTFTASTTLTDYIEQGDVWYKPLANDSGGPSVATIKGTTDPFRFLGIHRSDTDRMEALTSTNPDEEMYLHVFVASNGVTEPASVYANATLDYTALFREKKVLAQS